MMKPRIAPAALLLAVLGAAAQGAEVYRSIGPDGTVSYSDRPLGANAQFVLATGSTGTRTTTPAQAPDGTAANPAENPPEAPADPTLPEGPSSAELREQRRKNCEIARERLDRYALANRLFRTNAAGEREYLDDAAIADARAKATADVQDWCS